MVVVAVVFYLFNELLGYLMNLKINYDTYKLIQTLEVIKKKQNNMQGLSRGFLDFFKIY
jgi:hypothetical protein